MILYSAGLWLYLKVAPSFANQADILRQRLPWKRHPTDLYSSAVKITGNAAEGSFYLGRPWRPFAKTVFVNCYLDKQIKPEGWHNWDKKDAEKTAYYAEYKSKGSGANDKARVSWSHQLTDEEVKAFTLEKIFGDWSVGR